MHQSIATIDKPEFINLQPLEINPLMSSCEIKVLYVGENRNGTYIKKEVAAEMAKTLRGAPIVGYYKESKEDFADHGQQVIFDDEGVHFQCMTRPYGFVAPDAKVWFQKFNDEDDFGNTIEREYLMTTGYLWTGQYEECRVAVEEGRPHSMELDDKTLQGNWSENYNTGMEFFIINDAIFSKLCILGEDVEPCFEGSSVTAPKVSTTFTKNVDDTFRNTLYNMMQELSLALKGGQSNMEKDATTVVSEEIKDNFSLENTAENEETTEGTTSVEENVSVENETPAEDNTDAATEFAKKDEEDKKDESEDNKDDSKDSNSDDSNKEDKEDDEEKKKYTALQEKFDELSVKFTAIEEEYQSLKKFKAEAEDKEKDAVIARFYMLNDEDKKDIIANKSNYTLDEIEAKLSVVYTRQQLAQSASQKEESAAPEVKSEVVTYSLGDTSANVPDWVKAVKETEENLNK
jgi:hypothetical protein